MTENPNSESKFSGFGEYLIPKGDLDFKGDFSMEWNDDEGSTAFIDKP